jgi:hypothetical protein
MPWILPMANSVASARHSVDAAFVRRDGFVGTRPGLQATSRGTRPDRHLPDEGMVSIGRGVSEMTNGFAPPSVFSFRFTSIVCFRS